MKTFDREKILKKIQKCLAIASDKCSMEESAVAAGQARKLMDKYNLDYTEVIEKDLLSNKSCLTEDHLTKWYRKRWPSWITDLAYVVAKNFDCEVRFSRYKDNGRCINIYGYKTDVKACAWTFQFLTERIFSLSEDYWKERKKFTDKTSQSVKKAFYMGFCDAIKETFRELNENRNREVTKTGTDLVCLKKSMIEQEFGKFRYDDCPNEYYLDTSAYESGIKEGSKISLSTPLTTNSNKSLAA